MKWLVLAAPAAVIGAAWIPSGDGPSAAAARVGAPLLMGLGLFPLTFGLRAGAGFGCGALIVGAASLGVTVGAQISGAPAEHGTLVAWVLITFAVLLALVSPLLVADRRGGAGAVFLLLSALCCGTLAFASDAIPRPLLEYNPLVRMFWHGLSYDWLHAANVYPAVGAHYSEYPDRAEGVLAAALAAVGGAVLGGITAFGRRLRGVDS